MDRTLRVCPCDALVDPAAADEIGRLALGRVSLAGSYPTMETLLPYSSRRKLSRVAADTLSTR